MRPLEHIIAQYFTDEYGNPQAQHIVKTYTVSPVYNQVSLEGIADQHIGVEVVEPNDMYEVFNMDEISENSYFVKDYKTVYFHSSMAKKDVKIEYFNIGLEYIGADRVYTDIDAKGNIIETLADLIEKLNSGKETLQSLNNIGDVDYLIQKLERYILRCGQLHNSLEIELIKTEKVSDNMSNLVEEGKQVITRGLEMGVFDNQELQRKENEKERIDEFNIWRKEEKERQSNELQRIKNEDIRIKNENDRIDYTNNTIKPYMKKVEEWDEYFKKVAPELEKKYTVRLNNVEKESSDNVINTTNKLNEYSDEIESFKSDLNKDLESFKNNTSSDIISFKESIKEEFNNFETNINSSQVAFQDEANKTIDKFKEEINSNVEKINSGVGEFKKSIESNVGEYKETIDASIKSFKEDINKKLEIPSETIIENSSLQNNFINVELDKMRYYKAFSNEIVITGSLTGGTKNSIITILPEGIRPQSDVINQIIVEKNDIYENSFIKIKPSGEIIFLGDVEGLGRIIFQGIRFRSVS